MKISQTLRKPANWQDFESLCLLLWRAEWKSDDLKKNGRNGQAQNGVDISGHREGENEYSGIQCKCKPGNKPLTPEEIDREINNAKVFKPSLRRLVFASTADKDATIEEYVRIKDDENRKLGLFSIDLKSWQDIIDLLELHKPVLHSYLDIVADDYAVSISFEDGKFEKKIYPKYELIYYTTPDLKAEVQMQSEKNEVPLTDEVGYLAAQLRQLTTMVDLFRTSDKATTRVVKTNHSYCPLKFQIVNQGRSPIDDYKIQFFFDNKDIKFIMNNVKKTITFSDMTFEGIPNVSLEDGVGVTMYGNSIIPGDNEFSDDFFVRVPDDVKEVEIVWKLLSRHYSCDGKLKVLVGQDYVGTVKYDKEKAGKTYIGDYIEVKEIAD